MSARLFAAALSILGACVLTLSACVGDDNRTGATASPSKVSCGGRPTLKVSGSTAQENAMTRFVKAFEQACPGQSVNYTANGSGAGISEFVGGQTDFAGSDSSLSKDEYAKAQQRCARRPGTCRSCSGPSPSPTTSTASPR